MNTSQAKTTKHTGKQSNINKNSRNHRQQRQNCKDFGFENYQTHSATFKTDNQRGPTV